MAKPRTPPRMSAWRYALWLLARRDVSAARLRASLRRRGYAGADIEDTLARLQQHRYQNDARYACVKARAAAPHYGNRYIARRLAADGVAAADIAAGLQALTTEAQRAVAAQRWQDQPLDAELRARIWRHMAARGFGAGSIRAALAALQGRD